MNASPALDERGRHLQQQAASIEQRAHEQVERARDAISRTSGRLDRSKPPCAAPAPVSSASKPRSTAKRPLAKRLPSAARGRTKPGATPANATTGPGPASRKAPRNSAGIKDALVASSQHRRHPGGHFAVVCSVLFPRQVGAARRRTTYATPLGSVNLLRSGIRCSPSTAEVDVIGSDVPDRDQVAACV